MGWCGDGLDLARHGGPDVVCAGPGVYVGAISGFTMKLLSFPKQIKEIDYQDRLQAGYHLCRVLDSVEVRLIYLPK